MKSENRIKQSFGSEWEENVSFDSDDPDFLNSSTSRTLHPSTTTASYHKFSSIMMRVPSAAMSLADLQNPHLAELCNSIGRTSLSVSSSLSDLVGGSPFDISTENVLTIEELRIQMGSCFTCGVSWTDQHVSLDCSECGGYSCERPCPLCEGNCGVKWKRDFTMSHACGKARWQGVCPTFPDFIYNLPPLSHLNPSTTATTQTCGASQLMAQELCARLEQLSASAQT